MVGQLADPALEPFHYGAGPLVGLPVGVTVPPRLLPVGVGGVQRVLGRGDLVVGGIEPGVRLLERRFGGRQCVLGGVPGGLRTGLPGL
jgi:hypothetical protein